MDTKSIALLSGLAVEIFKFAIERYSIKDMTAEELAEEWLKTRIQFTKATKEWNELPDDE